MIYANDNNNDDTNNDNGFYMCLYMICRRMDRAGHHRRVVRERRIASKRFQGFALGFRVYIYIYIYINAL